MATGERSGGTIALLPMVAAIERVQVGTDKTAAELALVRLRDEVATVQAQWAVVNADLMRRRETTFNQLLVASALLLSGAFVAVLSIWADGAGGCSVPLLVIFGVAGLASLLVLIESKPRAATRRNELWRPYGERIREIEAEIAKHKAMVGR